MSKRGDRHSLRALLEHQPEITGERASETSRVNSAPAPVRHSSGETVVFLVRSDVKKQLECGKRKFAEGDREGARIAYEKALDLDPECAIAYFYLGFSHHDSGNLDLAKEYYLQAIDIDKKQALFLEHLARLHFELGEFSVCLVRFQEAQAVGPIQSISYGLMGRAYFELDRFTEAIDCLEKMLSLEAETRLVDIARYYLALSHLGNGSLYLARKETETLLESQEADSVIYSNLANRFEETGCLSLAKRLLIRISETDEKAVRRLESIEEEIERFERRLPQLFCSEEESLLHHIHRLSRFGTERIHRGLASLLSSSSGLVREASISYCRKFGFEIPSADLRDCLRGEPLVREAALLYLSETFDRKHLELMVENLNHPSKEVQLAAARYLERRGGPSHLPLLEGQMDYVEAAGLRRQIQRSINQIKRRHTEQNDAMAALTVGLKRVSNSTVRKRGWLVLQWLALAVAAGYLAFRLLHFFP